MLWLLAASLVLGSTINPVQAARSPKNPQPVNDVAVLEQPVNGVSADPITAAQSHLNSQASAWGINPTQFVFDSSVAIASGQTVVRFIQKADDALILGALVALTISQDGSLVNYVTKTGQVPQSNQTQDASAAIDVARSHFATLHGLNISAVVAGEVLSAIADPTLQSYVVTPRWVWRIEVYSTESLGTSLVTVDSQSLAVLDVQEQTHTLDSSPLVCNMQMMNTSASKKKSRSTFITSTSIKLKAKKSSQPLTGLQGKKLWAVFVVTGADTISSKVVSVKVKANQAVVLKPTYSYVPSNATYSVYVGTGKKKPARDAMKLFASGVIGGSVAITGALPTSGASFAETGIAANTFYTFVNATSAAVPICDYKNKGVKKVSGDGLAQAEKVNTYNYINAFSSYFSQYVDANTDINSEQYLGNVSPKLNYGKKRKCAGTIETGYCTPRITAFTNACLMLYGSLSCPNFDNAAWTAWRSSDCRSGVCNAVFIGRGFAVNDVIAHEITHGLTSALAFGAVNSTSGAISEALSDVFGESYDQIIVEPGETPDPTWGIGEDLNTANYKGAVRNMQGTYANANPVIDDCWDNNAEMHANVGPVNRFAWLLVNGGDPYIENGSCSGNPSIGRAAINPIGTNATESTQLMNQLIWSAIPLMGTPTGGSSISFSDFGSYIQATCSSLWSVSAPARCDSVNQALIATGIVR